MLVYLFLLSFSHVEIGAETNAKAKDVPEFD
jgi:hypothetical protein